jgi:hypothetical protein
VATSNTAFVSSINSTSGYSISANGTSPGNGTSSRQCSGMISMKRCKENPTYVFLFWELRGLSPNFHIHVSGA